MAKLKEIIVPQLPQNPEPCTAYALDHADGTYTRYLTDNKGDIRKPRDAQGLATIQAGDNVRVDSSVDPSSPVIHVDLPTLPTVSGVGPVSVNKTGDDYAVSVTLPIEGVMAGDNIEIDRTVANSPTIKAVVPVKSVTSANDIIDVQTDEQTGQVTLTATLPDTLSDISSDDVESLKNRRRSYIDGLEVDEVQGGVRLGIRYVNNHLPDETSYNSVDIPIEKIPTHLKTLTSDELANIKSKSNATRLRVEPKDNPRDGHAEYNISYTNNEGLTEIIELSIPLPRYTLPEHLASITEEDLACWRRGCEDIGLWSKQQEQPEGVFTREFTPEFA